MHVGVNAHLLSRSRTYRAAGISRHILNLVANLPAVAPNHRFTVFAGPDGAPDGDSPRTRDRRLAYRTSSLRTERPPLRILWEQLAAPVELARLRIDVLLAPAYVVPLAAPCPTVVTVHDLSFERMPHLFHRGNRAYLSAMTRASVRRAARVVAVSESTRRELVELMGVPEERIAVVHNGIEPHFRPLPAEEVERFRAERGLPQRFVLHLGTLEPRKNVATLVRAYARLRGRGFDHALVLAGGKGWLYDEIFALVRSLGLERDVVFPGYVPLEEQPFWYNAADAFAFPSLYEGFGFPPLEAMACGTPVVTSNSSSLPEVVGEAGLMVEPLDEAGLADAELRERLRQSGLARARRFDWGEAARRTVALCEDVVNDRRAMTTRRPARAA